MPSLPMLAKALGMVTIRCGNHSITTQIFSLIFKSCDQEELLNLILKGSGGHIRFFKFPKGFAMNLDKTQVAKMVRR